MAKKTKKSSRSNKSAAPWTQRLHGWLTSERSTHIQRIALKVFAVLLLIGGVIGGFGYLEHYVHHITQQRQLELTVQFQSPPAWAGTDLIQQICLSSNIKSDDFLLDDSLTETWAENLAKNPWVKRVNCVRKLYDGNVEISCELRKPIAAVQHNETTRYIDPEGVVLPAGDVRCHIVRLEGSKSSFFPQPGETVTADDLIAGLDVLTKIIQMDEQLPESDRLWNELAVLNVANYEGRLNQRDSHLTLYTKRATEIRWGAAVGRSVPYHEAGFKLKLSTLYRTYKKFGSFDQLLYVDLRDWRKEKADPLRQSG